MKNNPNIEISYDGNLIKNLKYINFYTFYIGIFILIIRGIYVNSALSIAYVGNYPQYLSYIAFFLLSINLLTKTRINKKWFILCLITLLIGILIYYFSGDNNVLLIIMITLSSKDIELNKIIKFTFISTLITFIGVITLSKLGKLPNIVTFKNGVSRNSFGFLYTSGLSAYTSFLYLTYILIRRKKYNLIDLVVGFIIGYLVYMLTRVSQDAILIFTSAILVFLINLDKKDKIGKLIRRVSMIIVPVSVFFIYISSYLYSPYSSFLVSLDSFLSGRLYLGRELITNYGIKLFGQNIPQIGSAGLATIRNSGDYWTQYFYIDSAYLRLIYMYGLTSIIIIFIFYLVLIKKIIKKKDSYLALIVIIIAIGGITGQYLAQFSPNFIWVLIFSTYTYDIIKEKENG